MANRNFSYGVGCSSHFRLQFPCMVRDQRKHDKIPGGFSAGIFVVDDRVLKIFYSKEIPPKHDHAGTRRLFQSQCDAFEESSEDPILKIHIPLFYGQVDVEDVLNNDGQSIKEQYLLDCCYGLERLFGPDVKIPEAAGQYPHIADAVKRFTNRGIQTHDACVFNPRDADSFKFIDIEMEH